MKYQAIASCRVSTPEQLKNGSMNRQERNVREAAILLDVELVRGWSQDQSSKAGKNINRKDLLEMLEYCKQNPLVKFFLVDEVDRFMRSIKELYYWEVEFEKVGVTVYYASQLALNTNDMFGKMSKLMEVFKAETSNDERSKKSSDGQKDSFKQGYYPSHCHQGYIKGKIDALHEPDPLRFKLLQSAGLEVLSRMYTPEEALRHLTLAGYLTPPTIKDPNGLTLRIDNFKKLLCCVYYAGIVEIAKWEIRVPGKHEPMWSEDDHYQLVSIVKGVEPPKYQRDNDNPDFPLKAILHSSDCEAKAKVTGFWKTNGKHTGWRKAKYRCRGKAENGKLCRREYDLDEVHENWATILSHIDLTTGRRERLLDALVVIWGSKQKSNIDAVKALDSQIGSLEVEQANLVKALSSPQNSSYTSLIREQLDAASVNIKSLQNEKLDVQDNGKDLIAFAEFSLTYLAELQSKWWTLERSEMQALANILFPAGVWLQNEEQKVHTPQIASIFALASDIGIKKELDYTSSSLLVELWGIAPQSVGLLASALQV